MRTRYLVSVPDSRKSQGKSEVLLERGIFRGIKESRERKKHGRGTVPIETQILTSKLAGGRHWGGGGNHVDTF